MATMPTTVLTLDEAAAFLRVSPEALRTEAEVGRVPGKRIAGDWRFTDDAIRAWLASPNPATANGHAARYGHHVLPPETPEEQQAFLALMRQYREEWGIIDDGDDDDAGTSGGNISGKPMEELADVHP